MTMGLPLLLFLMYLHVSDCFVVPFCDQLLTRTTTRLAARENLVDTDDHNVSRRSMLHVASALPLLTVTSSYAAEFAPGGTLVDYPIGVQVGNENASPSRAFDNSNVLFKQDYYFKFGTAAPFIPPGSMDFPKTMPFVPSQQRYDTLKKYGDRIKKGVVMVDSLNTLDDIPDPTTLDVYQLRPMGLLANGIMASENTGTTNELLLARYYINEIYLDIGDMRSAATDKDKKRAYTNAKRALNSYLGLINRNISNKVGDKLELLSV